VREAAARAEEPAAAGVLEAVYVAGVPPDASLQAIGWRPPRRRVRTDSFAIEPPEAAGDGGYAAVFSGTLTVPADGEYDFWLVSDGGSRLYLDNRGIVNNDGRHGVEERGAHARLAAGPHALAVTYSSAGAVGRGVLAVSWEGPGFGREELAAGPLGRGSPTDALAARALRCIPGRDRERLERLAALLRRRRAPEEAAKALLELPPAAWDRAAAAALAGEVLSLAAADRPGARLLPAFRDLAALAERVAAHLPEEEAAAMRAAWKALGSPETLERGARVYLAACGSCHQPDGRGLAASHPPLAGSGWLDGDPARAAKIVLHGLEGPLRAGGTDFAGSMPALGGALSDGDVAAVLTYARGRWGKAARPVTEEEVAAQRRTHAGRTVPWRTEELLRDHPLGP
jgi:mono/diheme cytochrome c family protein